MFHFKQEIARRIEDDRDPSRGARAPMQGRLTGPSFAAQQSPPWDPLSGGALPWRDAVPDPITGGGSDHAEVGAPPPVQQSRANTSALQLMLAELPRWHGGVQRK